MDFGYRKKHNFQFGEKTERTHCPRCMRTKEEAISEQTNVGTVCDDSRCCFAKDIKEAIEKSKEYRYCINCGHELLSDYVFCINCGCKRAN